MRKQISSTLRCDGWVQVVVLDTDLVSTAQNEQPRGIKSPTCNKNVPIPRWSHFSDI